MPFDLPASGEPPETRRHSLVTSWTARVDELVPRGGIRAMAYNIKDQKTDELIQPILDSIRETCENESQRERKKSPLWDRL